MLCACYCNGETIQCLWTTKVRPLSSRSIGTCIRIQILGLSRCMARSLGTPSIDSELDFEHFDFVTISTWSRSSGYSYSYWCSCWYRPCLHCCLNFDGCDAIDTSSGRRQYHAGTRCTSQHSLDTLGVTEHFGFKPCPICEIRVDTTETRACCRRQSPSFMSVAWIVRWPFGRQEEHGWYPHWW